jgi:hypothetical protein
MIERNRRTTGDTYDRYEELAADAGDEERITEDADRYADATRDAPAGMSERVESAAPDEIRLRPDGKPRDVGVRRGDQHQPQHEDREDRKDPSLRNEEEWLTEGYSKEDLDFDESEERIDHP